MTSQTTTTEPVPSGYMAQPPDLIRSHRVVRFSTRRGATDAAAAVAVVWAAAL